MFTFMRVRIMYMNVKCISYICINCICRHNFFDLYTKTYMCTHINIYMDIQIHISLYMCVHGRTAARCTAPKLPRAEWGMSARVFIRFCARNFFVSFCGCCGCVCFCNSRFGIF